MKLKVSASVGTAAVFLALVGCTTSDPVPPTPSTTPAVEMSVTLFHCGLRPITYQGKVWEDPSFPEAFNDMSAPSNWRGRGTVTEVNATRLLYRDESGVEVTFVPDADVPDRGCD